MITYSNTAFGTSPIIIDNIKNNIVEEEFSIFPNPNKGLFNINLEKEIINSKVLIYKISGELVKSYWFKNSIELSNYRFNLTEEVAGTYFIKIESTTYQGISTIIIN